MSTQSIKPISKGLLKLMQACEAKGLCVSREQFIKRCETRPGWQGRPKPHLVCGHRWTCFEFRTGKAIVSRPTWAQVGAFLRKKALIDC